MLKKLFQSLFHKQKKDLTLPDSLLVKKLKAVAQANGLDLFENITLYHHTKNFFIPLLIVDVKRGIYLFEYKEWSYDDLKGATVQKAQNQESSDSSLAYEQAHSFIKQKFKELTHQDGVEIFNFLLMENLNVDQYEHLDESFHSLLPKERVMFSDTNEDDISQKLQNVSTTKEDLGGLATIIGPLLIQYLICDDPNHHYLATSEQMEFIDKEIEGTLYLNAPDYSGKTNTLLLKAVIEKLKSPTKRIVIIKPTTLACDILKQKLLNIIEYAIVEIDMTTIEIITPTELLNKHLLKLKLPLIGSEFYVHDTLMKKRFDIADLLLCDDATLMPEEFLAYIEHIQKDKELIITTKSTNLESSHLFTKSFKDPVDVEFIQSIPHAKTLQLISKLSAQSSAQDIMVVSSSLSKEKLQDDLEFFIEDKALLLDSSKNLLYQELDSVLLSTYDHIGELYKKHIILLDVDVTTLQRLLYAINLAQEKVYVVYENEHENIQELRKHYESDKEPSGVEETTQP